MIERAVGRAPTLEPRRPSKFEAAAPMPAYQAHEEFTEPAPGATAGISRSSQPIEPAERRGRGSETHNPPDRPTPVADRPTPPPPMHQAMPQRVQRAQGVEEIVPAAQLEHSRIEAEASAPVARTDVVPRSTAGPVELRTEHRVEIVERETSTVATPFDDDGRRPGNVEKRVKAAERAIEELSRRPSQAKRTEPQEQAMRRQGDGARRTIPVQDVRPAALPAVSPRPKRTVAAQTETTVQISIGRIEVRAHVERPAVSGERRRAPQLGLEEYLRQREGA